MKTTVRDPIEFEVLASGLGFTEGPVIADDGSVYCVDIDGGRVIRLANGSAAVVAKPGGGPNGMAPETATTVLSPTTAGFCGRKSMACAFPSITRPTPTSRPTSAAAGWSGSTWYPGK